MAPDPVLPEGSSIPQGIYSGTVTVTLIVNEDGDVQSSTSSGPLTLVVDENGRLLDAAGVPFLIGKTYHLDAGIFQVDAVSQSISAFGTQLVLRFAVTAVGDVGDAQGTFTGTQTDTIDFDANLSELHFVRTLGFGGVDSNRSPVTFLFQTDGVLRP